MIYTANSMNLKTGESFRLLITNSLEEARNACSRDYAHLTESEKKRSTEYIEGFSVKADSDADLADALNDYMDGIGLNTDPDFYEEYKVF